MGTEFTVQDLRRLPSPDPTRMGKEDVIVTYQLADGGFRLVRLPSEGFDEDKLKAAVARELAERAKWAGKKFTVE